ncbi:hypothetical protein Tco_0445807 [Tanacetum coccineum]
MAPLPPREQRNRFLRYESLEYTYSDIADFESRLERIYTHKIHKVQVVDFLCMPDLLRDSLFARMAIEHRDEAEKVLLDMDAPHTFQFQLGGVRRRLSWRHFIQALGLHTREEMESLGFSRYWSETGRKSRAHISGRQFIARLAGHFGLLTAEIL